MNKCYFLLFLISYTVCAPLSIFNKDCVSTISDPLAVARFNIVSLLNPQTHHLIPKTVHFVCLDETLLSTYKVMLDDYKAKYPDWNFIVWGKKELKDFGFENDEFMRVSSDPEYHENIFGYEILYRHGGLLVRSSFSNFSKLDILHKVTLFYGFFMEDANTVTHKLIGAIPGHPILRFCIDMLEENVRRNAFFEGVPTTAAASTGSFYITEHINRFLLMPIENDYIKELRNYFLILPASYLE